MLSRELDFRVAREVMELVDHDTDEFFPTMKNQDGQIVVPPEYSKDMNDAMTVVEKMRGLGWYLSLVTFVEGKWEAEFWLYDDDSVGYVDDTPARAICFAALEAITSDKRVASKNT